MTAKERVKAVVDEMPDDATYEQIIRELAFGDMIDRGLKDSRDGNVISNEEMKTRLNS